MQGYLLPQFFLAITFVGLIFSWKYSGTRLTTKIFGSVGFSTENSHIHDLPAADLVKRLKLNLPTHEITSLDSAFQPFRTLYKLAKVLSRRLWLIHWFEVQLYNVARQSIQKFVDYLWALGEILGRILDDSMDFLNLFFF